MEKAEEKSSLALTIDSLYTYTPLYFTSFPEVLPEYRESGTGYPAKLLHLRL